MFSVTDGSSDIVEGSESGKLLEFGLSVCSCRSEGPGSSSTRLDSVGSGSSSTRLDSGKFE